MLGVAWWRQIDGLSVPSFEHYKDVVMSCVKFESCSVDEFVKWGGLAYKRNGNTIVAPAHAKAAL